MKKCGFCGAQFPNQRKACPGCGAAGYSYVCDNCGSEFNSRYCPNCGKSAEEEMRKCPVCRREGFAAFCAWCGANMNNAPHPVQPPAPPPVQQPVPMPPPVYTGWQPYAKKRNKWVAFFLCLFLGYVGIHKFYEDKAALGILYFFTGGLCGIGWIVDCIILLLKPGPEYYL